MYILTSNLKLKTHQQNEPNRYNICYGLVHEQNSVVVNLDVISATTIDNYCVASCL